jgi:quercetin dioxygenase-like cupin family protein
MNAFEAIARELPRIARASDLPWVPSPLPGKSSRPLRFLRGNRGFVELLRMEPGVAMPPHRHTGETHAFNLSGSRRLDTGEIVGPGDYVYEPPGNVDSWEVVGEEPLLALVVVMGEVEDLAPDGSVRGVANTESRRREYADYCRAQGIAMLDLDH